MAILGILIIIATGYFIIKRYEVRMVLIGAGALMTWIAAIGAGDFEIAAFTAPVGAFAGAMTGGLVPIILTVMGFAFVLKLTECDAHLVNLIAKPLAKVTVILVPGTVVLTYLINTALVSAAGVAAAVGAVMIPTLIAAGVKPAMAATAVMAGTFGSTLSPGNAHNATLAGIADVSPVEIVQAITPLSITAMIIGAVTLTVVAFTLKENKGHVAESDADAPKEFKVNVAKAMVPLVPLALLVLSNTLEMRAFTVPEAMFIGVVLACVVSMANPQEVSKQFFSGMGMAYAEIIGIIIAATVFSAGMTAIGLTGALLDFMANSHAIVGYAAFYGPMLLGALTGSGDAATITFNQLVTPHAADFGMTYIPLGNLANIGGALGRTMSPVAGAAIVLASMAKVSPIEIAKRNAPGMIIASIVLVIFFA